MPPLSSILHLDLDCFYAQVERQRLNLPPHTPLAVIQWSSALAVSYPARALGVKRGMVIDEIRKLCGDAVHLVHVETIGNAQPADTDLSRDPDVLNTQKVSLARYRAASASIFQAMQKALDGYHAVLERASIDEAYIDVSIEADHRARNGVDVTADAGRMVVVGGQVDMGNESDLRLMHAADIAVEVRQRVLKDCGYTVSAGVSVNKLLAKFASAKNKPDGQTVVPFSAIADLIKDVPLRKLRGLGGKLGKEVEDMGVTTAGEAARLSMEALEAKLGRKFAEFVYQSVRGEDETKVKERDKTKSLLAAKSFQRSMSLEPAEKKWLPILAEELAERVAIESELHNRQARTLVISFRVRQAEGQAGMVTASRSVPMPAAGVEGRAEPILKLAIGVLRKVMKEEKQFTFPINFVGLTGANFLDRASAHESISRYFSAKEQDAPQDAGSERMPDSELDHEKRLQERRDREMALRLHREESMRGVRNPIRKQNVKARGAGRRGGKKVKNGADGAIPLDRFFVFSGKSKKS
eukprot:GFKZ01006140.1.p2 GENE.GFKZ01006140.1~~GFKZ01006140.1.p2  ORF type:complete len:525 (-),score=89.92 GFKZ01006140.1:3967-5541(-)